MRVQSSELLICDCRQEIFFRSVNPFEALYNSLESAEILGSMSFTGAVGDSLANLESSTIDFADAFIAVAPVSFIFLIRLWHQLIKNSVGVSTTSSY